MIILLISGYVLYATYPILYSMVAEVASFGGKRQILRVCIEHNVDRRSCAVIHRRATCADDKRSTSRISLGLSDRIVSCVSLNQDAVCVRYLGSSQEVGQTKTVLPRGPLPQIEQVLHPLYSMGTDIVAGTLSTDPKFRTCDSRLPSRYIVTPLQPSL